MGKLWLHVTFRNVYHIVLYVSYTSLKNETVCQNMKNSLNYTLKNIVILVFFLHTVI